MESVALPEAPMRERRVTWSDPRAIARAGQGLAGLDFLRALIAGTVPPPPIVTLMGITLAEAEPGRVTMRMPAGEYLYNPIGSVHGGALATLLDSVMGCAVHSTLPAGRGYTTLEIKVNYLRAVTEVSGCVTATGRVVHAGRRQAVAEASLADEAGRLCATASTTCLVFDLPTPREGQPRCVMPETSAVNGGPRDVADSGSPAGEQRAADMGPCS